MSEYSVDAGGSNDRDQGSPQIVCKSDPTKPIPLTIHPNLVQISQLLQAMSELDKGLLNERRTELEKQRKRREQQELNQKLTAQLAELKEQCAQAEKRQVDLRNELARVEDIRKEQKKIDIQKRKDEGNYWLPVE